MNNVLTVSQLNRYISFKFKEDANFHKLVIKGEISNFTHHYKSGHFYFTLKDNDSSIKVVMFNNHASLLKFKPENGMNVFLYGSVSVYEKDGLYQVYATDIVIDGTGALFLAFEQLKKKLSEEGVFDEDKKKPLPFCPRKIGVATAASGAALQDIINILSRRYSLGEMIVFTTLVQGENAVKSICTSIKDAENEKCDVLILARGGGSFEDLNSFNHEDVAYAIYNSNIPIISAVGHETDYTIADFVSDLRAPTPSAAAELVAPSNEKLLDKIKTLKKNIISNTKEIINKKSNYLNNLSNKLESLSMENRLKINELKLKELDNKLFRQYEKILLKNDNYIDSYISKLDSLNPLNVLKRGFSLTYKEEEIIYSSSQLKVDDEIKIKFNSGEIKAKVICEDDNLCLKKN